MRKAVTLILTVAMLLSLCCFGTAFADEPKTAAEEPAAEAPADTAPPPEEEAPADPAEEPETEAEEEAAEETEDVFADWNKDAPALKTLIEYVEAVTDENSPDYIPVEDRIATFDMDGTLYGELFPTYFDECLLLHRLLHDEGYEASPEDRAWALSSETALLCGEPEPDSPRSGAQMAAEAFRGFTVEEYRTYVREFMSTPAAGFDGMTYAEGFYLPMVALVEYLAEHGFTVFISSGAERSLARERIADTLGEWIPPYRVIGSTFSLTASGQGGAEGRK